MKKPVTIEQLERQFERETDDLDREFLTSSMTQEEYDRLCRTRVKRFEEEASQIRTNAWGKS